MRLKHIALIATAIATLTACSDDDGQIPSMPQSSAQGTFVDERDGFEYHWVRYGNLDWMVDNAHYYIDSDAYCLIYTNTAGTGTTNWNDWTNWQKYGCIYTLEGARIACPKGWRIPSDDEWQQLEQIFGMSTTDTKAYGWRGNIAQNMLAASADSTNLHLQLGGYYSERGSTSSSSMREWSVMGFYWTSTLDKSQEHERYFYRKLMWNKNEVFRHSTSSEDLYFSVRYVRDAFADNE